MLVDSEQRRLVVSGFWRRVQAKESMLAQKLQVRWIREVSYPNFVRGPLLDDMRPFFGPCEVLDTHH